MLSGSIPHIVNGVSRQADAMRLKTHLKEQVNRLSSPATGNQKRPPLEHVAQLSPSLTGATFYHPIIRDDVERYHVLIRNGDLHVWDQYGAAKTVTFPDGKTYLNTTAPVTSSFSAATSADYTVIANNTKKVLSDGANLSETRPIEALIFVRAANYNRTYKIIINGNVVAQYKTSDGVDTDVTAQRRQSEPVTPTEIAKTLFWGNIVNGQQLTGWTGSTPNFTAATATINGWSTASGDGSQNAAYPGGDETVITQRLIDNLNPSTWSINRYGNVLHVRRVDGSNFRISTETDRAGDDDSIVVIKDRVQKFATLPNHGPLGFVVKVHGDPVEGSDDYWVKITKSVNNDNEGNIIWEECPKPGQSINFDATTMPHVLVRNADGTFTFKKATWVDRAAGDLSAFPSFLNGYINDVVFSRGRLAMTTGESLVMSRPTDYFNFFRSTLRAVLDDDPVDIAGTSDNVAIFKHGIQFNDDLYLWASQSIHKVTAGDILTPKNVALPLASNAKVNTKIAPVATMKSMLFLGTMTAYADVREVFIDPNTTEVINSSVSDHVPGYIPSTVTRIVASDVANMAVVSTTEDAPAYLYVYQYFWTGSEKLQAAWHKWKLPGALGVVIGTTFFDDNLHIITKSSSNEIVLSMIRCSAKVMDGTRPFAVRLDRRIHSDNLTPSPGPDTVAYTLPYSGNIEIRRASGSSFGTPVTPASFVGPSTYLIRNADLPVYFGEPYESYVELARLYVREARGEREQITSVSPFRIRRLFVHFSNSVSATAIVVPYVNGPELTKDFSSFAANVGGIETNKVNLVTESMSVPVKARSDRTTITFRNDSSYPDCITGYEWEGEYDMRAQRI